MAIHSVEPGGDTSDTWNSVGQEDDHMCFGTESKEPIMHIQESSIKTMTL